MVALGRTKIVLVELVIAKVLAKNVVLVDTILVS